MTLGLALVLITVAMGFATMLVGTALAQFHMIGELPQQLNVRCMSDSLLALAMERVASTQGAFGDNGIDQATIVWGLGSATASLSFASSPTLPYSTNNVAGDHPTAWLRHLPQGVVHLVALASTEDGYSHMREVLMFKDPYPYALTSSGPISSTLGLVIGAVQSSQYLKTDLSKIPVTQQQPCDIASNCSQPFFAMAAAANCEISGDALACGGILVPPSSVQGAVQSYTAPVPLPSLDVPAQRPAAAKLASYLNPIQKQDLNLEGYCVASNGLTETGNVKLDGSLLYVEGDLVVNGALYGKGAVFASGSITINGGSTASNLATDQYVAMAAANNLTLNGNGRQNSFFAGVLYCGGVFSASHITLQGSCINNGPPATSGVTLTDFEAIAVPDYTSIKFDVLLPPGGGGGSSTPSSNLGMVQGTNPNSGQTNDVALLTTNGDGSITVTPVDGGVTVPPGLSAGDSLASIFGSVGDNMTSSDAGAVGQAFPGPPTQQEAAYLVALHAAEAAALLKHPPPPPPPYYLGAGGVDHWTLDYNQFIGFGDQMRLLLWRDTGGPWKD